MEHLIARFGTPGREMVGILSLPEPPPGRAAWLLCNPFGQEAVRSKPMYRALAERLAREGCTALRFDFHGTGDSPGELAEQSLETWIGDVLAADAWLRGRLRGAAAAVHWFGLRLGANVAALAAERASRRPNELLLWDPVMDGREYVEFLLRRHREALSWDLVKKWPRFRSEAGEPEPSLPGTVLGFEVGSALAADLRALGPPPLSVLLEEGIRIGFALEPGRVNGAQLPQAANLECIAIESSIDWTAGDSLGSAIAPQDVQRAVLASTARR